MMANGVPTVGTFSSIQKKSGIAGGTITEAIRLLCVLNADGNGIAPNVKKSFLTIIYDDTLG